MYIAVVGADPYKTVQLREDSRIPGTKKKKTNVLKSFGRYDELLAEDPDFLEKLKAEARRLTKEQKEANKAVQISLPVAEILKPEDAASSLSFGHALIAHLWRQLGLDTFFSSKIKRRNADGLTQALYALSMHRICQPDSVLATVENLKRFVGLKIQSLDLHYEALNVLYEYREELIDFLGRYFERQTKRKSDEAYYDVTTYYFESVRQGELRMFGFSKDGKRNEVQVVMGLLIDSNGIPITFELFPGNTVDQKTLKSAVSRLKEQYNLDKVTIVADRGLNGKDNLLYLEEESHDFVVGYTLKNAAQEVIDLALSEDGWTIDKVDQASGEVLHMSKIIPQKLELKCELSEEEKAALPRKRGRPRKYKDVELDVNLHISWSAKRAERDRTERHRLLEKSRKLADNPSLLEQTVRRGRNRYLDFRLDTEGLRIDEGKIAEQERYDGFYALVTNNKSLSGLEVSLLYDGLWTIEESFRILKTDLKARPVFVWTDERIHGHFALCFLALCIVRYLQYLYTEGTGETMSAERIRHCLLDAAVTFVGEFSKTRLVPVNINEDYLRLHTLLGLKPLRKSMTITQFRSTTKLDPMMTIEQMK